MSVPNTCYGWQDGNDWFLSLKPREAKGPKNKYSSKADAVEDAKIRDSSGRAIGSMNIIWQPST